MIKTKDRPKIERHPIPEGLIILLAIAGAIVGGVVFAHWIWPNLPSGTYPIILFIGFIVGCGFAAAAIGAMIYKLVCFAITVARTLIYKLSGR